MHGPAAMRNIGGEGARQHRWLFVAILALVGLWNLPTLWYPYGEDQALAHVIGRIILDGGVPYRDAWDVKPPGIFYLHSVTIALLGEGMHWTRMADLLGLWATMSLMFRVGVAIQCPGPGLWGALLLGLSYPLMGFWNTALQEGFLLPCLWGSLLSALRGWHGGGTRHWVLSGVCLGIVFWFKYPYALPLGVVAIAACAKGWLVRQGGPPSLRYAIGLGAGFVGIVGLGGIYLWKIGVLGEMLDITIAKNIGERLPQYGQLTQDVSILEPWDWISETPLFVCVGALGVLGILLQWIKKHEARGLILMYGLSMVAAIYVQIRFSQYHWIPLLSFFCFWSGLTLNELSRGAARLHRTTERWTSISATGLLGVLLIAAGSASHERDVRLWSAWMRGKLPLEVFLSAFPGSREHSPFVVEDWRVAELLREMEISDETLFVWGARPLVYYFSGLEPVSRFLYGFPLHIRGSRGEAYRDELQEALRSRPPGVILVAVREQWTDTLAFLERLVPRLHAQLGAHYILSERIRPFLVYVRIPEAPERD